MPSFETSTVVELVRDVRLYLRAEAGLTGLGSVINRLRSRSGKSSAPSSSQAPTALRQRVAPELPQNVVGSQQQLVEQREELEQLRRQLASKDQELDSKDQELEQVRQQLRSKSRELVELQ